MDNLREFLIKSQSFDNSIDLISSLQTSAKGSASNLFPPIWKDSTGPPQQQQQQQPQFQQQQQLPDMFNDSIYEEGYARQCKSQGVSSAYAEEGEDGEDEGVSNRQRLVYLEKSRSGRPQKSVSGSQFRMISKDSSKCQQCEQLDKNLKKSKETVRSLKVQIGRLEEKLKDFRKARPELDGGTPQENNNNNNSQLETLQETNKMLLTRLQLLESENSGLKRKAADLDQRLAAEGSSRQTLSRELHEAKQELSQLTEKYRLAQQENVQWEERYRAKDASAMDLQHKYNDSRREVALLQNELQAANDLNSRSQAECKTLTEANVSLEKLLNLTKEQVSGLQSRNKALEKELEESRGQAAKSGQQTRDQLKQLTGANEELQSLLSVSQKSLEAMEKLVVERDVTLDSLTKQADQLKGNLAAELTKREDLIKKMTSDSKSTQEALERAITASVRLCVVAPTVNVHIPDKKVSMKSGVSDKSLKEFLMREVLDKYCFLFKQRKENASPEEDVSIQEWVEKMLNNMQSTIERHVQNSIQGSDHGNCS